MGWKRPAVSVTKRCSSHHCGCVLTEVAKQAEDVRDVLERVGVRALDAVELELLGVREGLGVRGVQVGVLD